MKRVVEWQPVMIQCGAVWKAHQVREKPGQSRSGSSATVAQQRYNSSRAAGTGKHKPDGEAGFAIWLPDSGYLFQSHDIVLGVCLVLY